MERQIDPKDVVYIGIGEDVDPMPEVPKTTKFWVTAAACADCGCPGRWLIPHGERLILRCVDCAKSSDGGIDARLFPQVTFVYWCKFAKFPSDQVDLTTPEQEQLEEILRQMGQYSDIPFFAMIITGGVCVHAFTCLAEGCPYRAEVPREAVSLC